MFRTSLFVGLVLFTSLTHSVAARANEESELFEAYSAIVENSPDEKAGLNAEERKTLFTRASQNKVANLGVVSKYDPQGIIGFCFGRATTVHLTARKMGLKQSSIRKLFIIGDLRSNPARPEWRFHVTTLVKGTDRKWYAVDPIMTPPLAPGRDLPVEEWIKIVKKTWDYKNGAHLYVTSADAIVPEIRVDADGTTGERIIELAFNPDEQDGFRSVKLGGVAAFQPSAEAEATHFLLPASDSTDNRFEFLSITVPGLGAISYNKYFVDLLKTFTVRELRSLAASSVAESAPTEAAYKENCPEKLSVAPGTKFSVERPNLHSFRLGGR